MRVVAKLPRPWGAVLFWAAASVQAQPAVPVDDWGVSAGITARKLVERADNGARLVTESGPLLRLQLDRRVTLANGGALSLAAGVASGALDYDGVTQGGAPLHTASGQRDVQGRVAWRPWPAQGWGEAWLVLAALQQRRQIASQPLVQGLRETSNLLLAGVRWETAFDAAGWRWRPSIEAQASAWHRVQVAYGGAFDDSTLRGGRRRVLTLAIAGAPIGSAWEWSTRLSAQRQSASTWQTLYGGGAPVGNVRQPRIAIDEFGVQVRRAF